MASEFVLSKQRAVYAGYPSKCRVCIGTVLTVLFPCTPCGIDKVYNVCVHVGGGGGGFTRLCQLCEWLVTRA